ncbi:MAG: sulfatase [Isosphaeraceae bacterium]|nr:sulfatase [Isosphaeraceae bacterium]
MRSIAWLAPALLVLAYPALADDIPKRPPNVIFILADDLGWADISPQGSSFHETPNLERLARRSARFTNYYAASPLCSPTRSSILTGLYPARTGITAPACHLPAVQLEKRLAKGNRNQRVLNADSLTRLKGEYTTTAEILRDAGYATAHFGKWHLGHGAGYEPRDQGFELDIPHTPNAPGPGGGYLAPWRFVRDAVQPAPRPGEHIDTWMASRAAEYIVSHKDRPFFMDFWLYSVHSPWNARADLIERFRSKADPASPQRNPLYAAMVASLDDAVGILLDAVERAGVADDTIIVFTSDNGGWAYPPRATDPPGFDSIPATSNAPLRSGKASNYEGGTRVPCLVSWPGRIEASVREPLFSSVDWLPTLLTLAGLGAKRPSKLDGIDQTPAILEGKECRREIYVHFPHGSDAQSRNIPGFLPATWVRVGDWKLIRFHADNPDGSDRLELFDLRRDVGETMNRATEAPEVLADLSKRIEQFLVDTEAVVPKRNPQANATEE